MYRYVRANVLLPPPLSAQNLSQGHRREALAIKAPSLLCFLPFFKCLSRVTKANTQQAKLENLDEEKREF